MGFRMIIALKVHKYCFSLRRILDRWQNIVEVNVQVVLRDTASVFRLFLALLREVLNFFVSQVFCICEHICLHVCKLLGKQIWRWHNWKIVVLNLTFLKFTDFIFNHFLILTFKRVTDLFQNVIFYKINKLEFTFLLQLLLNF